MYVIDADGTNLRPLTGFGLLADLPGPTGVVTGRVVAPTLTIGTRSVTPSTFACIVSAQGASVTASCENDGTFRLAGVPAGSRDCARRATSSTSTPCSASVRVRGSPGVSRRSTSRDRRRSDARGVVVGLAG